MRRLENSFGLDFKRWFLDEGGRDFFMDNCSFEFKITHYNTWNIKGWRNGKQGHQESSLKRASNEIGLFHIILKEEPYDAIWQSGSNRAYMVIKFIKYNTFFCIPVRELPDTDVLKYEYCLKRWEPHEVLKKERKIIEI